MESNTAHPRPVVTGYLNEATFSQSRTGDSFFHRTEYPAQCTLHNEDFENNNAHSLQSLSE